MSKRSLKLAGVSCVVVAVAAMTVGRTSVRAMPRVFGDAELVELAKDTFQRRDWIYATAHMSALIQRNPPALRDNPAVAKSIEDGLAYAIARLEDNRRAAADCGQGRLIPPPPPMVTWPN